MLKQSKILFSFAIITLTALTLFGFYTGPSTVDAQIIPVAYSDDGVVLCKTHYSINESGAHAQMAHDFGWLIVSKKGLWNEIPYKSLPIEFKEVEYDIYDSLEVLEQEFKKEFSFKDSIKCLDSLIFEYDITNIVHPFINENVLFWTRYGIQNGLDSILQKDNTLKSIQNLTTDSLTGTRVGCNYYIKELAFFDNSYGIETPKIGASYFNDYYLYNITGICVVPEFREYYK